jgi:hypothetical protein
MTAPTLAAVLAVLIIRALQSPAVRQVLAAALAAGAVLAAAAGYGAAVLGAAVLIGGGTFGAIALLSRLIVPAPTGRTA